MAELGANFNKYVHLQILERESAEELQLILASIKTGYQLVAIYWQGGKHIAWINPVKKIVFKEVLTKEKIINA